MAAGEEKAEVGGAGYDRFETTHWSLVLAAAQDATPESRQALANLCEKYWPPVYAYIRRRNYRVEDAQDLTQGFFARLLEKGYLKEVRRDRGKFRAFLLTAVKHYLANERDRALAAKRGGGAIPLSLDFAIAEGRCKVQPVEHLTPEKVFERRWIVAILEQALSRLKNEYVEAGKGPLFNRLKCILTEEDTRAPYSRLATELEMSEGAVKVAVHRLRRRFGRLLREEIAQTLSDPAELEDEIHYLFSVFS